MLLIKTPRHTFKKASLGGDTYLFPLPVIREKKYLIRTHDEFSEIFLNAFENKYLDSPDVGLRPFVLCGAHTDGRTQVLEFDYDNLHFKLLKNRDLDPDKATTIETLLSKKIAAFLRREEKSHQELRESVEKQKKCKTCQSLGINDTQLKNFFNLIDQAA